MRRRWTGSRAISLLVVAVGAATVAAAAALAAVPPVGPPPPPATGPMNMVPPSIVGTMLEGSTINGSWGSWTGGSGSLVVHWQRCDSRGAGCADIGPPAQLLVNLPYVVSAEDVGHTLRLAVTATNAAGAASMTSQATAVVSSSKPPVNTARPAIAGKPKPGAKLMGSTGTWTGGVGSYAYQWRRCNAEGAACTSLADATSATYTVAAADAGGTFRVVVTGKNLAGSTIATSVASARVPGSAVTTTAPNRAPTLSVVSLKRVGTRAYVRFKVCDDAAAAVTIIASETKAGSAAATHRFSLVALPCKTDTQDWALPARFRQGPYTVTLHAVDKSGTTSTLATRSVR